ncbi:MAG: GNAT family N-acetyltransferase [Dinoroseobacter sp.]|nr:GNAT family N-acetyltransferase [Dinoroseobacter sp.]
MIEFRTATPEELSLVLGWAAREGWNPGLDDAPAFFAADPFGFFVGCDDGVPIAAISVVNHSPDFAFLGLYIVQPEHRGKGIGMGLWSHALAHAGDRVVGLDGVPDQQANYRKSGFAKAGGTTRYSGAITANEHSSIVVATAQQIPDLIALEESVSGAIKPAYLNAWFSGAGTRISLVDTTAGSVHGVCTIRKCQEGAKVGPLIARDRAGAQRLLEHAATVFGGALVIDVPDASGALAELCRSYGMSPSFETARMYRGVAPNASDKTGFFAVASLELG